MANKFEEESKGARRGFLRELYGLARDHKKWWLVPILVVLVLAGALIVLGSTGAAPFLYTLF